jgi:hypothetical protein
VKVCNVGSKPVAGHADFLIHLAGPGGSGEKAEAVGMVVGFEHLHINPVETEHLNFGCDHAVFTTRLPVSVV